MNSCFASVSIISSCFSMMDLDSIVDANGKRHFNLRDLGLIDLTLPMDLKANRLGCLINTNQRLGS